MSDDKPELAPSVELSVHLEAPPVDDDPTLWLDEMVAGIPASWLDLDLSIDDLMLRYVRALEERCDAAGVSRELWPEPELPPTSTSRGPG